MQQEQQITHPSNEGLDPRPPIDSPGGEKNKKKKVFTFFHD